MYASVSWHCGLPVVTVRLGKLVISRECYPTLSDALVVWSEYQTDTEGE